MQTILYLTMQDSELLKLHRPIRNDVMEIKPSYHILLFVHFVNNSYYDAHIFDSMCILGIMKKVL